MKPASSLAAAATLLLHAALIAVVAFGLSGNRKHSTPPAPMAVQIVTAPTPPASAPAPTPAAAPVLETKPPKEKPRDTVKPARRAPESGPAPAEMPAPAVDAETALSATPAAPAPAATPSPPAAGPAIPAATALPTRTPASAAGHAAGNRRPPYPRLSKQNNEEGTVVLRVLVKADGTAGAVELKTSSGYPLLDKSALATVPTWRFKPATVNGRPVDEWYEQAIPFKLEEN